MTQLSQLVTIKDHFLGSLDSPATLLEYGDYQCLVCRLAFPIIKQLLKEMNGKICFVFRHFPLKTSHPLAFEGAKAAESAALQNRFWEMHNLLYAKQNELHPSIWPKLAEELHLDIEKFNTAFHSSLIEEKIQNEFMAGVRSGVNGTPCFYINGNRFDGDASYDNLKKVLSDQFL